MLWFVVGMVVGGLSVHGFYLSYHRRGRWPW